MLGRRRRRLLLCKSSILKVCLCVGMGGDTLLEEAASLQSVSSPHASPSPVPPPQGLHAVLRRGCPDMESAASHLLTALTHIEAAAAATPPPPSSSPLPFGAAAEGKADAAAAASTPPPPPPGFDENVNRNLVVPCPPRAVTVSRLSLTALVLEPASPPWFWSLCPLPPRPPRCRGSGAV